MQKRAIIQREGRKGAKLKAEAHGMLKHAKEQQAVVLKWILDTNCENLDVNRLTSFSANRQ